MWSPAGSPAVDQVGHRSPALGLCTRAAVLLIRVHTHLRFQVWAPRPLIVYAPIGGFWACPPRQPGLCSGCTLIPSFGPMCPGSRIADQDACPLRVSVVGTQAADLGGRQLGFRCVLGLFIWCSQSRSWGGRGARVHGCWGEFSKQPLRASIFSFSFQEIPPIQAPLVQTSTWPLTQPHLALSQESCSRPWTPAGGFSCPGPRAGPRDLIVLKHSSYCLIFQCPLSLVSDLHIC